MHAAIMITDRRRTAERLLNAWLPADARFFSRWKLTRRQSIIEGKKLSLEAGQLKFLPVVLILLMTMV